jgi:hypothetical protein
MTTRKAEATQKQIPLKGNDRKKARATAEAKTGSPASLGMTAFSRNTCILPAAFW